MIKEYLIIENTQYPMVLDGAEGNNELDSELWNVYRGNELVGIIASSIFQPVLSNFMIHAGMIVFRHSNDVDDDGNSLDIYALGFEGDAITNVPSAHNGDNKSTQKIVSVSTDNLLTESTNLESSIDMSKPNQVALPDNRITGIADDRRIMIDESNERKGIINDATNAPSLIDLLDEKYESVHEITNIFGKSIEEVLQFLTTEGEHVGFDALVGIHEENNQRCIVMHETEEHKEERERKMKEYREAAISKLTIDERKALGL